MEIVGIIVGLIIGFVYALFAASIIAIPALLVDLVLTSIANWVNPYGDAAENISAAIVALVITISLIIGMGIGIPTVMVDTVEWSEPECYVSHEIINLADNNEIKGNFRGRYVRGYIGEETVYHYYFKQADGGMKLQKASEKSTIVYYTNDETPHADWYRQERTYWWNTEYQYFCKIYIPEGSMTTEFAIDME